MSDSLSSPIIRLDADQSGTCQNMDIPNLTPKMTHISRFTPLVDMWSFFYLDGRSCKGPENGTCDSNDHVNSAN